jgi:hypothetical protein
VVHRKDGRLPASYEVVFGQAWTPGDPVRPPKSEDHHVSLDELKRQLRLRRDA